MSTPATASPPRSATTKHGAENENDPGLACTLVTAKLLIFVGGTFFSLFALANGVFLVAGFFIFLLLGCICRSVVSAFARVSEHSNGALSFGAMAGMALIIALSAAAVAGIRVLREYVVGLSDTADSAFDGAWQLYSALAYTYLAVCIVKMGELGKKIQPKAKESIEDIDADSGGDDNARRSGLFHAAMSLVVREAAVKAFFFLCALGGTNNLYAIPMPAGVGFLAGLLSAGALVAPVPEEEGERAATATGESEGATTMLTRAASRVGGVISEKEQARVISNAWESRRAHIIGNMPPERRDAVAALVTNMSFDTENHQEGTLMRRQSSLKRSERGGRAPVAAGAGGGSKRDLEEGTAPSAPNSPASDDDDNMDSDSGEPVESWEAIVAGAQARANAAAVAPPDSRTPVASQAPQPRAGSLRAVVAPHGRPASQQKPRRERQGGFGCVGRMTLAFSAMVLLIMAAGLAAVGMLGLQDAGAIPANAADNELWNVCGGTDGVGNSAKDVFFRVLREQFGYECAPTQLYVYSWFGYWLFAAVFCTLTLKTGLCGARRTTGPVRRRRRSAAIAAAGTVGSAWGTHLPDPSRIRYHKTAPFIRGLVVINIALGLAYMWWRVTKSMDGVSYPIWSWVFFGGECILMWGVFTSHAMRCFPAERDRCTMDELVELDGDLGAEATVAVLLPTAGEKLPALKQGILGAYSQRLWKSSLSASKQLRVCVLDEKRRPELLALCDIVYQLAVALSEPTVQRELCVKLDEAWVSPKIWMDTFEQMGALDRYIFGREAAQVFELSTAIEEMVSTAGGGHFRHRLQRASSGSLKPGEQPGQRPSEAAPPNGHSATAAPVDGTTAAAAGGNISKAAALEPGFKRIFSTCDRTPSIVYYARKDSGMPRASPKAGNMNSAIFATELGAEAVVGGARIVMVNDARHRIKGECLQRTVPYFYRLAAQPSGPGSVSALQNQSSVATVAAGVPAPAAASAAGAPARRLGPQPRYVWHNVAFVQLPQRFEDTGDGDPLANHAALTFFVANVGKDGVGGVTSCGQGGLWRVDALSGFDVKGKRTIADPVLNRQLIGHQCGFRAEVLIEDTHTSLSLFRLGWRSAYVCEPGEALAICVDPPNTVSWRVKQVFRWHLGAVQLLFRDGLSFVFSWRMPTIMHRIIALDSVSYFFQSIGGLILIVMPIVFAALQEPPFEIRTLEFVYFFVPYLATATLPTLLAVSWKGVHPDSILTDEQFWMATCYVQFYALLTGIKDILFCSDPKNAWAKKCPTFPLPLTFIALGGAAAYTTARWVLRVFNDPFTWFASLGTSFVVMHAMWPMFLKWLPRLNSPGRMPSAYVRKLMLVLIFVAVCGLLVVFAVR